MLRVRVVLVAVRLVTLALVTLVLPGVPPDLALCEWNLTQRPSAVPGTLAWAVWPVTL